MEIVDFDGVKFLWLDGTDTKDLTCEDWESGKYTNLLNLSLSEKTELHAEEPSNIN